VGEGEREGQSLRKVLIKLEGEDPRQKGFHFFFKLEGVERNQKKKKKKKVLQKNKIMGAKGIEGQS